ncbi:acyl-CoA dehydrogenase family protein [Mycobacterium sp. CVI_P3]|uniref:Acyl-CoA dehydrogenase family protein n=1 Tax=Mycobacterium pinniadriaticum TaxID=2994102 RepID=A0ABT3SGK0_9MYCO|nr:acyl-CoA dehydrogenase family protein [Mycobacterium pinniadriaticum]MCX2932297.1 acyl-CoA dehydrogenase family protein [Mycobacterium pinniadriaticum]MCX2938603.1 acyl-CoA dehydrogenase family protein [Mycobacterium pinniadriaticum]
MTTSQELAEFDRAADRLIASTWGGATAAENGDVGRLWLRAVRQGWFELGAAGALDFAIAVTRRLGRVACPLPVADAFAAASLPDDAALKIAEMRIVVVADPTEYVDAGGAATHVLVVPRSGGQAQARPIITQTPVPGLAVPAWNRVELGPPSVACRIDPRTAERVLVLTRLGKAARALAAAGHAHELAIEHAKSRTQFGRVIGSFGAVQQRVAQCQIDIRSADLMLQAAVAALQDHRQDATFTAELAIARITAIAPAVQLAAHHTLAASGYFNEHALPWLFRRVHADITMLSTLQPACGSVGDVLVETEARLPRTEVGDRSEGLRVKVRRLIAAHEAKDKALAPGNVDPVIVKAIAEQGWLGFEWPPEYGGQNASLAEQVVLNEETTYHRVGAGKALGSVMLIGSSILRHGTEEQKAKFLPIIRSGELDFCLGYSEPEAGSDLASLRTRAVRDGDDWVINGQKLWTTGAHVSDWVWLAARTDPDAQPRHAGITVFLFPLKTSGVTIQEHTALSGEVSCSVFYDDVRVPDTARVGDVNGGWSVIVDALAGERITMGNIAASLHRQLDDLVDFVSADPTALVGGRGSYQRAMITDLAVRVQAARTLVSAAVGARATDIGAMFDGAMAGVMAGDLAEDFGEAMLSLFGPVAALSGDGSRPDIPGGGAFEYGLRQSIMYVVGGGTNDVQRGLIARGLGLPR